MRPTLIAAVALAGLLAAPPAAAQYDDTHYLHVLDPQNPWWTHEGTIEEATVTVQPHGIYTEVGLYLTFSARDAGFPEETLVEVVLGFSLPKAAVVTDSWLWVGDDIVRADLIDRWTASQIYEDIVRRRRDPSILTKIGPGRYELRVYPMPGTGTRKVKITYLVPTDWAAAAVSTPLPTRLLQTSLYPVDALDVQAWTDSTWSRAWLSERPDQNAIVHPASEPGRYTSFGDLPTSARETSLHVAYAPPLTNGVYLSHLPGPEAQWYQMALLPAQALDLPVTRKVLVLLDFDTSTSDLSEADVVAALKNRLLTDLGPEEYFNIMYARLNVRLVSPTWIQADSFWVDAAFEAFEDDPLATYSNLPTLLAEGIAYAHEAGDATDILLVSSSERFGDLEASNQLLNDLLDVSDQIPPLHIADFGVFNNTGLQVGDRYYAGNSYFFTNLARLTGGNFTALRENADTFTGLLAASFRALSSFVDAFDLHTTLDGGFSYARFSSNDDEAGLYLTRPILQVGKYVGSPPFVVEASGVFEGLPFNEQIRIDAETLYASDTTLTAYWTGQQISSLEEGVPGNDVVAQIIDYSLRERVLSQYTAFLALEPSDTVQVCETCDDVSEDPSAPTPTEEDEVVETEDRVDVYPNPFRTQTTIEITLAQAAEPGRITLEIYNAMGQIVRTFPAPEAGRTFTLTWDGTNEAGTRVASGLYFFVLTTPSGRQTVQIVLIR